MRNWRSDAAGKITGLRVHTIANLGAYLSTFSSLVPTFLYAPLLSGQYNIPAIYAEVDGVYTNTAPVDAYRGAGRPEATFVVERLVEVAARETGREPPEFRRLNFVTQFPHQTPVIMTYDVGNYAAALDKAIELADYKGVSARKSASAAKGLLRGVGFSAYIEACGLGPSRAIASMGGGVGGWELAEIRVNPIGTVEVLTGSHSHGQSHETTFAQLVSDRLGIPIENVSVVHGDTDKVQFGMGTYGSRSGAVGMAAISKALDKVEAKAKKVAGHVLEAAEGDIEFKNGDVHGQGHRQVDRLWLGRAERLYRAQVRWAGARARVEGRRVLGADQLHLPGRRLYLRSRDRPRDWRRHDRPLHRGGRLRQADQPDGGPRPGARRDRAGHRPGAARSGRSTTRTGNS